MCSDPTPNLDNLREGAGPPPWERRRAAHLKPEPKTEIGVILILIGWLFVWLSSGEQVGLILVGLFATVLQLVGVGFVALGRRAFDENHSRSVAVSVLIIVARTFVEAAFLASSDPRFGVRDDGVSWSIGLDSLWGLAFVLLVYDVAGRRAVRLLWGAYFAYVFASVYWWRSLPLRPGLVWLVPSLLFALAYYAALARIRRGETRKPSAA